MSAAGALRTLALLVRRSLRQHALSTSVTVASAALASGLVMAVFAVAAQTRAAFTGGPVGFDAVVGARGSALQLVLNAVFHLETSPGNLPWSVYRELAGDERVQLAVPYAVGDHYGGFRVVGTTPTLFNELALVRGEPLRLVPGGRWFDPGYREAVLGSTAARELGLDRGGAFRPQHGVGPAGSGEGHEHEEEYVVVGVLEPTGSPSDRVIWIPIEGVFRMGGHVLRGAGEDFEARPGAPIPDEHKEVSAVLLSFERPEVGFQLAQELGRAGAPTTLAWPIGASLAELFDKLGWVHRVLELVAYLVVLVAAASILASIYNSMNERRRELAVLRALGARRRLVSTAVVAEAAAVAGLGAALGYFVYGALFLLAAAVVRRQTGVVLEPAFHPALFLTPAAMLGLGALAGLAPAAAAYSTDVAANLGQGP